MNITVPAFEHAHVLVIGDVMLDRYWHGRTDRISPEAPVPIVNVRDIEERPGGAANVALNLAALGAKTTLFGLCGRDTEADIVENKLKAAGVQCHLQRSKNHPTIIKLRVLSLHQQLIRLDFESAYSENEAEQLLNACLANIDQTSAIILSDYGKGSLVNRQSIIQAARKLGIPVLVDPKGKKFSMYQDATLLTPNRKEFETIVGHCQNENEFQKKGLAILHEHNLDALLVTLGSEGMTLLRAGHPNFHLPAKAREIYDVTGAGDTVIAVLAAALAAKADLPTATILANIAASIAVSKLGAASVSLPELRRALFIEQASATGVMEEEQLVIAVADAKAHNERIVMTNGCFDILHAGHVAYLEEAKKLGDRLIVAINNDASVAKLKGKGRPINTLARRMVVLASLSAVDWVVPFSENTPQRLITRLLPDVLVKGSDYKGKKIAGSECVLANGGEVKLLKFKEGCSTTDVVKRSSLIE